MKEVCTVRVAQGRARKSVAAILAGGLVVPAVVLTGVSPAHAANAAPVFTGATTNTTQTVAPNGQFTALLATDADSDTLTFSTVDTLPVGITLTSTGVLAGTATVEFDGTVTVLVSDGTTSRSTLLHLTVNDLEPVFADSTLNVAPGHELGQLTAPDPNSTVVTFTLAATPGNELPTGITLESDGTLTGRVWEPGTTTTSIVATSGIKSVTKTLTVTVRVPVDFNSSGYFWIRGITQKSDFTIVNGPAHGSVEVWAYGDDVYLVYVPQMGHVGGDALTYTVPGSNGGLVTKTLNFEVGAAAYDFARTGTEKPVSIPVLDNDSSQVVPSTLRVELNAAENGSVVVKDGALLYTSRAGYSGYDAFGYTVKDGLGKEHYAVVYVEVYGYSQPVMLPVVPPGTPPGAPPVAAPPVAAPPVAAPPVVTPPAAPSTPPVRAVAPPKPVVVPPGTVTVSKAAVTVGPRAALPVTGAVAKVKVGTKVYVQLRQKSGRWATLAVTPTNAKGQFSAALKAPKKKGAYTYRISVPVAKTTQLFNVTVK